MESDKLAEIMGPMFEVIAGDGARALDTLALPTGAAVLDVGTGGGSFAIYLAMQGFAVTTGEPETDTTRYAGKMAWLDKAKAVGVADNIAFQYFDAAAMPFGDDAFAAVFFFGVLHHIDAADREAVVREALRVSNTVVFFEPHRQTLERLWLTDPEHPEAAVPTDYIAGLDVDEKHMRGAMMDIFMFANPA